MDSTPSNYSDPMHKLPLPTPVEASTDLSWLLSTFPTCASYFQNELNFEEIVDLRKVAELAPDPCWFIEHRVLPAGRWEMLIREEVFYGDRDQARQVAMDLSKSFFGEVRTQVWRRKSTKGILVPKPSGGRGRRPGVDYAALSKQRDSLLAEGMSVEKVVKMTGLSYSNVELYKRSDERKMILAHKLRVIEESRDRLAAAEEELTARAAPPVEQIVHHGGPTASESTYSPGPDPSVIVDRVDHGYNFGFTGYKDIPKVEINYTPPRPSHSDPLIAAMIDKLPPPNSTWSTRDRDKWIVTMEHIFGLVYSEPSSE